MDRGWWRVHHREAGRIFTGERVCIAEACFGATRVRFKHGSNSGAGAMCLAAHWGAQRIVMLGYDCKYAADGKRHWHGDHPRSLGNAVSMPKWKGQFENIVPQLAGIEVINATRDTALTFWPRVPLEQALC